MRRYWKEAGDSVYCYSATPLFLPVAIISLSSPSCLPSICMRAASPLFYRRTRRGECTSFFPYVLPGNAHACMSRFIDCPAFLLIRHAISRAALISPDPGRSWRTG